MKGSSNLMVLIIAVYENSEDKIQVAYRRVPLSISENSKCFYDRIIPDDGQLLKVVTYSKNLTCDECEYLSQNELENYINCELYVDPDLFQYRQEFTIVENYRMKEVV